MSVLNFQDLFNEFQVIGLLVGVKTLKLGVWSGWGRGLLTTKYITGENAFLLQAVLA